MDTFIYLESFNEPLNDESQAIKHIITLDKKCNFSFNKYRIFITEICCGEVKSYEQDIIYSDYDNKFETWTNKSDEQLLARV